MEVSDVTINTRSINKKKLDRFLSLIKKYNNISNPLNLLPKNEWHNVKFILSKTTSSMANAIRRVLIEELLTKCLYFDENELETNDEFILSDVLQKNIELLPINQYGKSLAGKEIFLNKYNETNDIINVKASDLSIIDKKTNTKMSIKTLIPASNITIIVLRPGKYVKIKKIEIIEGYAKDDAGKFSLLDNVKYDILDVEPYDNFKHTGQRSIEHDPTKFSIEFTTCGNIQPKQVIKKLTDMLLNKLTRVKSYMTDYIKSPTEKKYYSVEGFQVEIVNELATYKIYNEYLTLSNMLAHKCYELDKNILFCAPGVERLDSRVAFVKLKHPDRNSILLEAINACITDVKKILSAFN